MTTTERKEAQTANRRLAKKRVQWLIEHLPRINICAGLTV